MKYRIIVSVVLIVLAGAAALAVDAPPAATPDAAERTAPPWVVEVHQLLADRDAERVRLEQEFQSAPDETAALVVQRRMQELEESTELKIMNLQLVHLRQAGREQEADALATQIRRMTEPQPVREATPRPRTDTPEGR